jgi:glutathione S-transferase
VPIIYHIATAANWERALRAGAYTQSTLERTLEQEGFIHASSASQVTRTANKFYRGVPDLLLLSIDAGRLTAPLRYDEVPGSAEPFPHLYGPLNLDAVTAAVPFPPGPDGTFAFTAPA